MNAQRRKEIGKILNVLAGVQMDVEAMLQDEEDAFANILESLEGSERYESAERSVSNLQEAETYISNAHEQLKEATQFDN